MTPSAATLSLVETRCALCGGDDAALEASGLDFEYATAANAFRFVRCRKCGHVYLSPRPKPSDLGVIYPSNYYTLAGTSGLVTRMRRTWEGRKVKVYEGALGEGPKRSLDVGCGDGRFLQVLKDFGAKDWELVGIDFDPKAVERCRARGFTAYETRVEEMGTEYGTFDAVVMLQLIEHVEDPAVLAHRYALSMEGVDTVILGVKNRAELAQCVEAEAAGPLPPNLRARIDGLGLAVA